MIRARRSRPQWPSPTGIALAAALLLLAGCETPPALAPLLADPTPERPTAVQESVVTSSGVSGLAPFEGSVTVLTRPDMRREQSSVRATGAMSRWLVQAENRTQVTRLDLQQLWLIDLGRGEYRECPLTGCPGHRSIEAAPVPGGRAEPGCTMRVVSRDSQLRATGAQQQINGWKAAQSVAVLTLELIDNAERRSTSTLTAQVWTVAPTAAMRAAHELEQRYEAAATRAIRAEAVRRVPAELRDLVDSLLADVMSAQDRIALLDLDRDLAAIGGQPVRTELRWDLRGDACGGSGLGPVARALGADGDAPVFAITHELRRYEVAPVRDSQFQRPTHYRRRAP